MYQGRLKSFPVESGEHFFAVARQRNDVPCDVLSYDHDVLFAFQSNAMKILLIVVSCVPAVLLACESIAGEDGCITPVDLHAFN
jgi:hypothetical protein